MTASSHMPLIVMLAGVKNDVTFGIPFILQMSLDGEGGIPPRRINHGDLQVIEAEPRSATVATAGFYGSQPVESTKGRAGRRND